MLLKAIRLLFCLNEHANLKFSLKEQTCDQCLRISDVSDLGMSKYWWSVSLLLCRWACLPTPSSLLHDGRKSHQHWATLHCLSQNSMKIMRAGRWELKSSRISILQLLQKDGAIKQRAVSRMPIFLGKQNRPERLLGSVLRHGVLPITLW